MNAANPLEILFQKDCTGCFGEDVGIWAVNIPNDNPYYTRECGAGSLDNYCGRYGVITNWTAVTMLVRLTSTCILLRRTFVSIKTLGLRSTLPLHWMVLLLRPSQGLGFLSDRLPNTKTMLRVKVLSCGES